MLSIWVNQPAMRGGGTVAYDFLINNDGDALTPNSFLNILALGNATLSGKTVAITAGTYSTKTISLTPASTVTFKALTPGNKPKIANLVIDGAQRVDFDDIDFIAPTWENLPQPAVKWDGTFGNITMRRCSRIGNYRGTLGVIDPNAVYPEYACIIPQFNGSGQVTSYSITRDYVGDLMADGTYNMVFNNGSGVTWSVFPTATFTVAGGVITGTTPGTAGSSNATTATNNSIGALSARITWTGQRRMGEWLAYGDKSGISPVQDGPVTLIDCEWHCLSNGYKRGIDAGQTLTITGARCDLCYQDSISIPLGAGTTAPTVNIEWPFITRPFALQGDAGDPHGDGIQTFHSAGANYNPNITITGPIIAIGSTRGGYSNGIFLADSPVDPATYGYYARVRGAIYLGNGGASGICLEKARDSFTFANTIVRQVPTGGNDTQTNIRIGPSNIYGNNYCGNNISEGEGHGTGPGLIKTEGNVSLGLRGVTIPYDTVFNTPATGSRATISDILTAMATEPAYASKGHTLSGYVDYVNRTVNEALEPTYVQFTPLDGQTPSSAVSSEWRRIIGGPSSVSISISGGTYQIADDEAGTNATVATSSSGTTTRGKFVRVNLTNSASGSTTTTATLTLNGYAHTFRSKTQVVLTFAAADNGTTGWSVAPVPSSSAGKAKLLLGVRLRSDDPQTANANVLCAASTTPFRLFFPSSNNIRFQFLGSGIAHLRPVWTPDTTMHTHLISIDFTQPDLASGVRYVIDGTPTTFLAGTAFDSSSQTRTFDPATALAGGLGVFNEADGGGAVLFNGDIEMIFIDWFTSAETLPDITDPAISDRFSRDLIGSDGSGVYGTQPKYCYFSDSGTGVGNADGSTANTWNATLGLDNRGSLASKQLTKQAGTYA